MLLILAPAVLIAGPWYLLNFRDALGHMQVNWSPWHQAIWGTGPRWSWGWFIGFWRVFLGQSISSLGTLALCLGLLWHARRTHSVGHSSSQVPDGGGEVPTDGVRCLLVWMMPGLLAYLLSPLRVERHMVPFAILALVLIGGLLGTAIWERRRSLALLFAGGFTVQALITSLPTPLTNRVQVAGWSLVPVGTTVGKDWQARELVKRIDDVLTGPDSDDSPRCIWIVPQHGGLQSTVLSYWAYLDNLPVRFEYARKLPSIWLSNGGWAIATASCCCTLLEQIPRD